MKVAVGSKNPTKIAATKAAFATLFPNEKWDVVGIEVSSEVSSQPMSDTESIKGARNRAQKALQALQADFGVGLEGGLEKIENNWFDAGWIVVMDKTGKEGIGQTIRMQMTPEIMRLILEEGKELGDANDIVFGVRNSKEKSGHFGHMTNDAITRTRGYTDGVITALIRFVHPNLF